MTLPISVLDLATIEAGPASSAQQRTRDALLASVTLAQQAEASGYLRVWYAEHHNMTMIASSAPAVLIAHIATQTSTIRLGAGGVMLPNHAPLPIAEQFGTLAALNPGRIDLGLGRAPGSDQRTMRALRRGPAAAEDFPRDVLELQGYLTGHSQIPGVSATPGAGTNVPLYILGSSLYGAQLAAALGLPYAFASHFAPAALHDAVTIYRERFQPSEQLERPYVIAGVNVIAADDEATAQEHLQRAKRVRVALFSGGRTVTDEQADAVLASPQGQPVHSMMQYSAVGTPPQVRSYAEDFARHAEADELIVAHQCSTLGARLRSVELFAEVMAPVTV